MLVVTSLIYIRFFFSAVGASLSPHENFVEIVDFSVQRARKLEFSVGRLLCGSLSLHLYAYEFQLLRLLS